MKTRREFFAQAAAAAQSAVEKKTTAPSARPAMPDGIQIGDPIGDTDQRGAIVWSRADRRARLVVEASTTESFASGTRRYQSPIADPRADYTARVELNRLPPGQTIHLRAWFEDGRARSEVVTGRFRTPAREPRPVRLLWSGDCAGQGWGINREWGGYRIFDAMLGRDPDLFIHSGDVIYADNPIPAEVKLADGSLWRNVTTEAKSKVAETLDEYRGNYRYNFLDANLRRFAANVPQIWQWDDHEVMNNWHPAKDLTADNRYREKDIRVLAARARQAFLEYAPMRLEPRRAPRIFRRLSYGPLLDVFLLDLRSYRGPNTYNRQAVESQETAYLGRSQRDWLQRALLASKAQWKVIASDMPISLNVGDGKDAEGRPQFEASANGDHGAPAGRELEIAALLGFIKRNRIRNTVWVTADVHYTAAHHFHPDRAAFRDFDPFFEFVSGPLNAGTFGPGIVDRTFGMEVLYAKAPAPGQSNLPPSAGLQFFGELEIDPATRALTTTLRDLTGAALHTQRIEPA